MTKDAILGDLRQQMVALSEAFVFVIEPPSVPGIGTGGGLKGYVQDRAGRGLPALEGAAWAVAGSAMQTPGFTQAFTLFNTRTPQIYADIDRTKAEQLGVPISRVFETLSVYMGSAFVNDFNILGRTYRVTAQADNPVSPDLARRRQPQDPQHQRRHGADRIGRDLQRHDRALPRAALQSLSGGGGAGRPGAGLLLRPGHRRDREARRPRSCRAASASSGRRSRCRKSSPATTAFIAFGLGVVFVFLLLSALYESWLLPLAVILIVPMCILAAMIGVNVPRARPEHPRRDRPRRAGRPGGQERHPDRGVRQAGARKQACRASMPRSRPRAPGCGRS